jgi:hypothetical protein
MTKLCECGCGEELNGRLSYKKNGKLFEKRFNYQHNTPVKLHSPESKLKMSLARKGKRKSEEWKKKIGIGNKGKKHPKLALYNKLYNSSRVFTDERRKNISESFMGEKNCNWNGGKSFEQYSRDWNYTLRIAIRERDNYTCQLCGVKQGDITHSVHHIDYDKKNCNPTNLITLCRKCHLKTNHNRDKWVAYFNR